MIAAGSTVTPNSEVPDETIAMGSPAKRHQPLTETARQWIELNPELYQQLARRHATTVKEV